MIKTSNRSFIESRWIPSRHPRNKKGQFSGRSFAAGVLKGAAAGGFAGHIVGREVVKPAAHALNKPASKLTGKADFKEVRSILNKNKMKNVKIKLSNKKNNDHLEFEVRIDKQGMVKSIPKAIVLSRNVTRSTAFHELGHAIDLKRKLDKNKTVLTNKQIRQLRRGNISISSLPREFQASKIAVQELKKTGVSRVRATVSLSPAFVTHAAAGTRPLKLGALVGGTVGGLSTLEKPKKKRF